MTDYINVAKGATSGEQWSMTVHTEKAGGTLAAAQAAWAAALAVLWNGTGGTDSIGQFCKSTTTLTTASTAELDALTGKQLGRVESALALAGTSAGETLPPQLSVVCSLRTALATRAGRGRFYLPPFTTSVVTAGLVTAASQAIVSLACQKFLQSLNTATYIVCVYHRSSKTHDIVTTIDVGNVYDTQRRRRDKLIETRSSRTL
jgi:hypothetical protein